MIKPCVYIITNSSNNVLYTGVTSNLQKRMLQHIDKSFGGFSARYNLSKLVFFEEFGSMTQAIDREKQIKGLRREKKIKLIEEMNPEWQPLF
ncbi:MAG: GIY-YIG nuclease family protein [Rikenellaceae bacterium]|nr:GIY-YIG nuclease family protein [Rikenellaceae bacterium]